MQTLIRKLSIESPDYHLLLPDGTRDTLAGRGLLYLQTSLPAVASLAGLPGGGPVTGDEFAVVTGAAGGVYMRTATNSTWTRVDVSTSRRVAKGTHLDDGQTVFVVQGDGTVVPVSRPGGTLGFTGNHLTNTTFDGTASVQVSLTNATHANTASALVVRGADSSIQVGAIQATGIASPTANLQLSAPVGKKITTGPLSVGGLFEFSNTGTQDVIHGTVGTTTGQLQIHTEGPYIDMWARSLGVRLWAGGITWVERSDLHLKRDIVTIPCAEALQKTLQLRPVWYRMKTDEPAARRRVGLIAQETDAVLPEVVDQAEDWWGIRYTHLVPLLIGALQEQQRNIQALAVPIGGVVTLIGGVARLALTADAFPALAARPWAIRGPVLTTNETSWDMVRGHIETDLATGAPTLIVQCQNPASGDAVRWCLP